MRRIEVLIDLPESDFSDAQIETLRLMMENFGHTQVRLMMPRDVTWTGVVPPYRVQANEVNPTP